MNAVKHVMIKQYVLDAFLEYVAMNNPTGDDVIAIAEDTTKKIEKALK